MKKEDIDLDTMFIKFKLSPEGGAMKVATGYNISENIIDKEREQYMALLFGMLAVLEVEPHKFITAAAYAQHGVEISDIERQNSVEEAFELSDLTNILKFKGKPH